jgi:excinuclease ABC subunit A
VGTVTEVHDYLRVLFASIGVQHCPKCGRPARAQSAQQIVESLFENERGKRVSLLAPLARQRKGAYQDKFQELASRGFVRVRVDGKILKLEGGELSLDKKLKHDVDLFIDRIEVKESERARLSDSVESGLREGDGTLVAATDDGERSFSERAACTHCDLSFPELSPLSFSFNSPLGFCAECNGLGSRPEMDPELVVPNPALSIRGGAVLPWAGAMSRGEGWKASGIEWIADNFGIDLDKP